METTATAKDSTTLREAVRLRAKYSTKVDFI